mgnify:FL=1
MTLGDLEKIKHVHLIGIGGIGVSAIARMMLHEGKIVSGSDAASSMITDELMKLGVVVMIGQRAENLPARVDLVVYSPAVSINNPELVAARARDEIVLSYPEMLGLISSDKFTIAIAGTHGKTTTTAMVAQIMIAAGLDPTVIVGSLMTDNHGRRTNFIAGHSRYLVVEACEYKRAFLHLQPQILVITNIDNDHLDYYRDLEDIKSAFAELVKKLPASGVLVDNFTGILAEPAIATDLKLKVPGEHNRRNAAAALAVARALGVSDEVSLGALNNFAGTWRRFEYRGQLKRGAVLYDDYAHHPTEIAATIAAARSICSGRLLVIFQPHLYSRTKLLFDDLVRALGLADLVFLADIYAAREAPDPTISSADLATQIVTGHPGIYLPNYQYLADRVKNLANSNDLVLTMGAGDIFLLAEKLLS